MADGIPQGWVPVANEPKIYKATVPGIIDTNKRSTNLPVETNYSNGNFIVYEPTLFGDKAIYTYNASDNKPTIIDKDRYNQYFSGPQGKKNYDTLNKTIVARTLQIAENEVSGGPDSIPKRELDNLKKTDAYKSAANTAIPPATDPQAGPPPAAEGQLSKDEINTIKDAAGKGYKGRQKYPGEDLRYPEKMDTNQDCIQFKIIKYVSMGLGLDKNLGLRKDAPPAGNILATITLPMPSGGISDRNSVNWQSGDLNPAMEGMASTLNSFLLGGAEAGADKAKDQFGAFLGGESNTKLLKALITSQTIKSALGQNVLSRQYGVVINPNLELLFDSPSLRDFSFSFKMTPRSKSEAIRVRTIIRYFKQAMSVKRSESVLLLKAPHTFRIQYKTSTEDHPYLNRFKECALTNCSVNYTPDGQYMSYNDSDPNGRSMTAYELSLSFQELEPIFDDDYDDGNANPTNIGY